MTYRKSQEADMACRELDAGQGAGVVMRRHRGIRLMAFACVVTFGGWATPVSAESLGIVTGTIRLAGAAPARPPLPVYKNHEVCGGGVPDDRLVVGPNGGIRYAVVMVEGVRGGKKPERDATIILDNRDCRFQPHVQVAEVGQWLEIWNSDPLLHNADARIGNDTLFNVALPPARRVRKPLARPGLIAITCDVRHTWMSAFVDVADDPYHTVTDLYGAYEIRDLTPGSYTLKVWHEELGTKTLPIVVKEGATAVADVELAKPAKPAGGSK
jgi:hypothetical protein